MPGTGQANGLGLAGNPVREAVNAVLQGLPHPVEGLQDGVAL